VLQPKYGQLGIEPRHLQHSERFSRVENRAFAFVRRGLGYSTFVTHNPRRVFVRYLGRPRPGATLSRARTQAASPAALPLSSESSDEYTDVETEGSLRPCLEEIWEEKQVKCEEMGAVVVRRASAASATVALQHADLPRAAPFTLECLAVFVDVVKPVNIGRTLDGAESPLHHISTFVTVLKDEFRHLFSHS
jgi:hypothetical protein